MPATIPKPKFDASDLRAFEKIDSVVHSPARLAIVSVLASNEMASFTELRDGLDLTDGNLAAHLRALTAAGMLREKKVGSVLKPTTYFSLSAGGRTAFEKYLEALAHIVKRHR